MLREACSLRLSFRRLLPYKPALHLFKRLHSEIVSLAPCLLSPLHQKGLPQTSLARSCDIGAPVSHHHALREQDVKLPDRSGQHPCSRLSVFMLPPVMADTMLRVVRTEIDRVKFDPIPPQLRTHPLHQGQKVIFRIEAPRDPGLVRHNNKPITQPHCGPAKRDDPRYKPYILDAMQIADLNIHHPITVKEQRPPTHNSAITSRSESCQSIMVHPNRSASLTQLIREFAGRRAGVGYSAVEIASTRANLVPGSSSLARPIASAANPCHVVPPAPVA